MCLSRVDVLGVGSFMLWVLLGMPVECGRDTGPLCGFQVEQWLSQSFSEKEFWRKWPSMCKFHFSCWFSGFSLSLQLSLVCLPHTAIGLSGKPSWVVFHRPGLSRCPRSHPVWFITISSVMPGRDPGKQLHKRFVWANDWSSEDWDGVYS